MQRDGGDTKAVSSHTGRTQVAMDPPGGDTEFEGGRRKVTHSLTAHVANDAGPVNVDLIKVDRGTAMRWSSSRGNETGVDKWPASPALVADLPMPQSPAGVMDMQWHVDASASAKQPRECSI